MFSSRGMCQVRRTGVFEDILQVKGNLEVNEIVPLKGSSAVSVQGYANVDDLVAVDVNLSEASVALSDHPYIFVADRGYEVLAVREIHRVAGQGGSQCIVQRVSDGSAVTTTNDIFLDGANDTTQTVGLTGLGSILAKGDGLRLVVDGDTTDLSGCVITVILKQL